MTWKYISILLAHARGHNAGDKKDSILGLIPPPEKVTGRHMLVTPALWEQLLSKL